ncbi:MAG: hypothetical protein ACRDQ7_03645 [Haloechinothrix sp.]
MTNARIGYVLDEQVFDEKGCLPVTEPEGDEPVHAMPEDPITRPEEALDALEERVLGAPVDQTRDESDSDEPAFEQDIDLEDVSGEEGGHEAGDEPSG